MLAFIVLCTSASVCLGLGGNNVMVGGWQSVQDLKDKTLHEMAQYGVDQYSKSSNNMCRETKYEIKSARTQLVAGTNYDLTVEILHQDMKHGECQTDGTTHTCQIKIYDVPWTGYRNVEKIKCHKTKPSMVDNGFEEFKAKYNKKYSSTEEEKLRYKIFQKNMADIEKMKKDKTLGPAEYGATIFADISQEEFRKTHLMPVEFYEKYEAKSKYEMKEAKIPQEAAPDSFDWRDHGAVTAVKNQGSCGSCWAFSTTGNIEGQWKLKKGKLVSLSEQELVDCDKVDQGCNGGLPSDAYKQIVKLGGLETETEYKYKGEDEKCKFVRSEVRVFINSSESVSSNEKDMAAWLAKNGPISIGINAFFMQFYMGGISHPWSFLCSPKELDHGVLIVGYGTEGSTPYWIIKNSWGESWGEKGYYRVYRGGGVCGLNKMCTSAIVD